MTRVDCRADLGSNQFLPPLPVGGPGPGAAPVVLPGVVEYVLDANGEGPVCQETLNFLGELVKEINPPKDIWIGTLKKRFGVTSAKELNENQAQSIVKWAKSKVESIRLTKWSAGDGEKREASQEAAPFQTT